MAKFTHTQRALGQVADWFQTPVHPRATRPAAVSPARPPARAQRPTPVWSAPKNHPTTARGSR